MSGAHSTSDHSAGLVGTLADEVAIARLDAHLAQFDEFLAAARRALDRGRLDAAAGLAQIAALYAWRNPVGLFASDDLEQFVRDIGARLHKPPRRRSHLASPEIVLHVATQAYPTGGSTQAIAAWIRRDAGRRHRVCLTAQGSHEIPAKLLDAVASRSDVSLLGMRLGGLLARAQALCAAASQADVVVMHNHPSDVVPALAFAAAEDPPPIVFVDHCDHVFWLGTCVARVLMSMRDSGRALALSRRGVEAQRCAVVPRPLRPVGREVGREEAKRRLGLPLDKVLLVTAADGSKFLSAGAPGLLDVLLPVLEGRSDLILRAAGPDPTGPWEAAAAATDGRVRALGLLPDVSLLQQAADIYIDSFPFSSLTSLLEAGMYATPVVTYRGHTEECDVLGADTRGLEPHMLSPRTPEELHRAMVELVIDAEGRRERGGRTRDAILETHAEESWRSAVDQLYARAAESNTTPAPGRADRRTGQLDVLVDLIMQRTGLGGGARAAVAGGLWGLPVRERVQAARWLARTNEASRGHDLLSDWLRAPVVRLSRRTRAAVARCR